MLELRDATILKGGRQLFEPLSFVVMPGQSVTVMGPSGSGKSSLLAWMTGVLATPLQGQGDILLAGRRLNDEPTHQRRLGVLFQDDLLFPHLSVGGNLAFGLPKNGDRAERHRVVTEALAKAGLPDFSHRNVATLSGGERARVALLRTLLSQPLALLLDEPFSRLDLTTRRQIRSSVFAAASTAGLPILLVTHDQEDAEAAGGQIVHLEPSREGNNR